MDSIDFKKQETIETGTNLTSEFWHKEHDYGSVAKNPKMNKFGICGLLMEKKGFYDTDGDII